jgi:hypothetical protein
MCDYSRSVYYEVLIVKPRCVYNFMLPYNLLYEVELKQEQM